MSAVPEDGEQRGASQRGDQGDTPSTSGAKGAQPTAEGLRQYARQTLQQYANGVTLRGMRSKQRAAAASVAALEGHHSHGAQHKSPHMVYMQNLTAIVLLTIESLQQKGLVSPRASLIKRLRRRLGMAPAPAPRDKGCAC